MSLPYAAPSQSFAATPAQDYIDEVLGCVPFDEQRQRIEMELHTRLDPRISTEQAIAAAEQEYK